MKDSICFALTPTNIHIYFLSPQHQTDGGVVAGEKFPPPRCALAFDLERCTNKSNDDDQCN
jgi:hypothetical protein